MIYDENEAFENIKSLINYDALITFIDKFECPESCSDCCQSEGIIQILTKDRFETFKQVTDGIDIKFITDTIDVKDLDDEHISCDVYGFYNPCPLTTTKGRCGIDNEFLPLVCQIRPFVFDDQRIVNRIVGLHLCDVGIQMYEAITKFIIQRLKEFEAEDNIKVIEENLAKIKKAYNENDENKYVVVNLKTNIFSDMLMFEDDEDFQSLFVKDAENQ